METKKAGHVEIIISFVLFIGFLLAMFFLFQPFKSSVNPELVEHIFGNLQDDMTSETNRISVSLDMEFIEDTTEFENADCFEIKTLDDLGCVDNKIIVKNIGDENVPAGFKTHSGGEINIYIGETEVEKTFYTIYCSEEFESQTDDIDNCFELEKDEGQYNIGIVVRKNYWSEYKLAEFIKNFGALSGNYISKANDFSMFITEIDGSIAIFEGISMTPQRDIPKSTNVYSKTFLIETINQKAEIKRRKMTIAVW